MFAPARRWIAAASLVGLATLLPPLATGTTPAEVLLRPVPLLIFALANGVPVLVLREWAVRRNVAAGGLLLAGLGYGLLIEGLFAKTLFASDALPVPSFDGQSLVAGLNLPWTIYAAAWHAVAGVLAPIAVTHAAFPALCWTPWLPRFAPMAALTPVLLLATATFLSPVGGHDGTLVELVVLFAAIAALTVGGLRLRGTWAGPPVRWPVAALAGGGLIVVEAALRLLAESRPALLLIVPVLVAVVAVFAWWASRTGLDRLPALAHAGLGFYAATAAFASLGAAQPTPASAVVLLVVLGVATWGVARANPGFVSARLARLSPAQRVAG